MKIVFFKRPRPKQFNYQPLYYDKEKDEREQRKKDLGYTDSKDKSEQFRAELRRKWRHEREAKKRRSSELRTVLYLAIAGMAIYFIFFTDFFDNLVRVFTQ
ncbi:MAG: hypothetical protein K9G58_12230 [Bacteroidales bacterium]|nr:hypothetical protein [Bacteroidales bacterium]MCF8398932.1 hypothetical protein [Bacteroidales bacterium]